MLVIKKTSRQSCENFKYVLPFQSVLKFEHGTSLRVRLKAIRHLVHSRFSVNAQLFRWSHRASPCLHYFLQYPTSFRSTNISLPQIILFPSFCSFSYSTMTSLAQSICAKFIIIESDEPEWTSRCGRGLRLIIIRIITWTGRERLWKSHIKTKNVAVKNWEGNPRIRRKNATTGPEILAPRTVIIRNEYLNCGSKSTI